MPATQLTTMDITHSIQDRINALSDELTCLFLLDRPGEAEKEQIDYLKRELGRLYARKNLLTALLRNPTAMILMAEPDIDLENGRRAPREPRKSSSTLRRMLYCPICGTHTVFYITARNTWLKCKECGNYKKHEEA